MTFRAPEWPTVKATVRTCERASVSFSARFRATKARIARCVVTTVCVSSVGMSGMSQARPDGPTAWIDFFGTCGRSGRGQALA
jgi:hypothetical protein